MTPEERRAWVARRDPAKVRAADRRRYERHKEKRKAAMRAYNATPAGREVVQRAKRRWAERNPDKRRAQSRLREALRAGKIVRGPCERAGPDCNGRIEAHHDDYSKPLKVRWLCRRHHAQHHKEQLYL